jgi:hypothetical protein
MGGRGLPIPLVQPWFVNLFYLSWGDVHPFWDCKEAHLFFFRKSDIFGR